MAILVVAGCQSPRVTEPPHWEMLLASQDDQSLQEPEVPLEEPAESQDLDPLTERSLRTVELDKAKTLFLGTDRGRASMTTVTLPRVLASVDQSFPLLSAARQELLIAEAERMGARGAFDLKAKAGGTVAPEGFYTNRTAKLGLEQPTTFWGTSVFGGYRLGDGDFDPTFDGKRVTNYGGEFALGVRVPILQDGSIDPARRDLRVTELGLELAENAVESRRLKFVLAATKAYWSWVAAGRRLAIAEELLAFAVDRQQGVQTRVERGDLPDVESIDNRRLIVKRQAVLVKIRRDLQQAALALSLFLRDADGQPIVPEAEALTGTFPEPIGFEPSSVEQDLRTALERRPDLLEIEREMEQLDVDTELSENRLLPRLDLELFASQDLHRTRPSRTKGELELMAGLELSFPIQNRKAKADLRKIRAKRTQLEDKRRFLRETVRAEVLDAYSAEAAAFDLVQAARETADLTEQLAQAERRRFELGDSNVLILNLREQDAAEAELGVVESLQRYWAAVATYQAAIGGD